MPKPSLTIFLDNYVGGAQFYCSTLVQAGAFDQFDVRYIALDDAGIDLARLKAPLAGAPMHIVRFSQLDNLHHKFRKMGRFVPKGPGMILVDSGNGLIFLDACRQEKTVVYVCHDEDYVEGAHAFAHIIDAFIAHNPHFADVLRKKLPAERAKDVYFLPFGVRQDGTFRSSANFEQPLRLVFVGRLVEKKGVMDLPLIDDHLREAGVNVEWRILGCGPMQEELERAVAHRGNFSIDSPVDSQDMMKKASWGDVFVFPTRLDGTPLAVLEAMSLGLVPVISEFNPGVHWMVPAETGFISPLDPQTMASFIQRLHADRNELERRSQATFAHAAREFNITTKARAYAETFATLLGSKVPSTIPSKGYERGMMDRPWVPNFITVNYRRWRMRKG